MQVNNTCMGTTTLEIFVWCAGIYSLCAECHVHFKQGKRIFLVLFFAIGYYQIYIPALSNRMHPKLLIHPHIIRLLCATLLHVCTFFSKLQRYLLNCYAWACKSPFPKILTGIPNWARGAFQLLLFHGTASAPPIHFTYCMYCMFWRRPTHLQYVFYHHVPFESPTVKLMSQWVAHLATASTPSIQQHCNPLAGFQVCHLFYEPVSCKLSYWSNFIE
jgi:hypothetical protein